MDPESWVIGCSAAIAARRLSGIDITGCDSTLLSTTST